MLFPAQVVPPLDGEGLVHVRLLCIVPASHVAEQKLYSPQDDQAPLTVIACTVKNCLTQMMI